MRRCRPWTQEDTATTIKLLSEGLGLNAIGEVLNRSHHTVRVNMEKVPGYKSRGRGRPKGKVCPPLFINPKTVAASWDTKTSARMLSVSLRVPA
jgi:hypothetical protein